MLRWSVGTKIAAGYILALFFVVAVGVISFQSTVKLVATSQWKTHTHQVLGALKAVVSGMQDAETGQRGYLLTGDDRYLEPYHSALLRIDKDLEQVINLTLDNPGQPWTTLDSKKS